MSPALMPRLRLSIRSVFSISRSGVSTCFTAGFTSCSFYAMISVVLKDMHIAPPKISLFIASCTIAGMAMQLPAGFIADRLGRKFVGISALAASAVLAGCLMFVRNIDVLWGLSFLYCASFSPLYTVATGLSVERAQPAQLVGISSTLLFVWALGACCGPLVAAYAMSFLGDWSLFLSSFLLLSAMTIISIRDAVDSEDSNAASSPLCDPQPTVNAITAMNSTQ